MSAGGHMADMQARIKYNKSVKKDRRSVHKKLQKLRIDKVSDQDLLEKTELSQEELNFYREKGKALSRRELRIKSFSMLTVLILFVALVIWYLV